MNIMGYIFHTILIIAAGICSAFLILLAYAGLTAGCPAVGMPALAVLVALDGLLVAYFCLRREK